MAEQRRASIARCHHLAKKCNLGDSPKPLFFKKFCAIQKPTEKKHSIAKKTVLYGILTTIQCYFFKNTKKIACLPYKVQYTKSQTHCGLAVLGACKSASTLYPASLSIFGKIECISYWQEIINGSTSFQNGPKVSSRVVSWFSRT